MAKVKKLESEFTDSTVLDDEDKETLAAIDQGIRDAEAGRTVPAEEVRKLVLSGLPSHLHAKGCPKAAEGAKAFA